MGLCRALALLRIVVPEELSIKRTSVQVRESTNLNVCIFDSRIQNPKDMTLSAPLARHETSKPMTPGVWVQPKMRVGGRPLLGSFIHHISKSSQIKKWPSQWVQWSESDKDRGRQL